MLRAVFRSTLSFSLVLHAIMIKEKAKALLHSLLGLMTIDALFEKNSSHGIERVNE